MNTISNTTIETSEIVCCGQVNQGRWCQETYETAAKHAGIRARQLRKLGYRVSSSPLGPQVTGVGVVKLTMVNILPGQHSDTFNLPSVKIVRV